MESINFDTVHKVGAFLDDALSTTSQPNKIPTGFILTGPNSALHNSNARQASLRGSNAHRRLFTSLAANEASNLKGVLKALIRKATSRTQSGDDDDEDGHVSSGKGPKLLGYDLQILQNYMDERKFLQVVVAFEDSEAFDSDLLSGLIEMLGLWRDRIPFVCLFNIATSVDFLQQRLFQNAVKTLDGRLFDAVLSIDETEQVFEAVTSSAIKLWIGPNLMSAMLERQSDFLESIESFVHGVQYGYMSCFYANALSIFLDAEVRFKDIPRDHFEAVRNLDSFQNLAKRILDEDQTPKLRLLLDSDQHLYNFVKESVVQGQRSMAQVVTGTDIIRSIQKHLPNFQLASKSALYNQATAGRLIGSPSYRSLLLSVRTLPSDVALDTIESISRSDVTPDVRKVSSKLADELRALIKTNNGSKQPLRSEDDLKNSTVRTTVIAQKVELSKQKSTLSKQDAAYTDILRRFTDVLNTYFTKTMVTPGDLVFNEIFFYDLKSPYREVFTPRPRHAVERALATPHDYLDCECCTNGQNENEETTMSATQPTTALLYQLCLESGNLINASDLWQAYQAIVNDEDDDNKDENEHRTMALFQRALAELRYLGMVKGTRKREDHIAKVAWRGL